MAISFDKSVGIYESALKIRAERAQILSSNLANADTPGYQARDIDFQQALKNRMNAVSDKGSMATTQASHLSIGPNNGMGSELFYRIPQQPSVDGNTVEEHIEHAAFMENSLEFQTAFTLLNSRFKGLISAIKGE